MKRTFKTLAALAFAAVLVPAPILHADDSFAVPSALSARAVFSCTDLTMSDGTVDSGTLSNGVIGNHGDIASNGNIRISGGTVHGDATAGPGKGVNLSGSGTVLGTKSSASALVNCTPIDLSPFAASLPSSNDDNKIPLTGHGKNPMGGATHTEFTLSGGDTITLAPGTYYFTKFTVSGGSSITLTGLTNIFCTGKVDISGGSFDNALPYRFRFWVSGAGPFTLSGGSLLRGFVYAPAGAATVSSSTLVGGLFANQVTISGGTAHITRAVDDIPPRVAITSPANNSGTSDPAHVLVKGTSADDQTATTVTVNGKPAAVAADGTWQITLDLSGTPSPATVTAIATDAAGNTSQPATISIVTATPVISLVSPPPGSLLAARTVNLAGAAGTSTTLSVNGIAAAIAAGNWSLTSFDLGPDDGQHTLTIVGTNAAGSSTITPFLIKDTTPPTITASSSPLPNGAGWNRTDVTVSFVCSDATSGVATCPAPVVVQTETASQTVSGSATDKAGNSSPAATKTIKLDKTAPAVAITAPANGSTFTSPVQQVSGTVSDALSGVAGVTCNGAIATVAGGVFNCSVTLAAGDNTITAVATDLAGNPATATAHATYNPDSAAPVITITSPANGTFTRLATVTVTGTATDDVAVSRVTVNGVPATLNGSAWTATITLPAGDGPKTITAIAIDSSDKQTPAAVEVTLDTTPPAITIATPNAGTTVSNPTVSIAGTVTDALSGVASVTCNGVAAAIDNGTFTCSASLAEGTNTIAIVSADKAGNQGPLQPPLTVILDTRAPQIAINAPAANVCIDATTLTVSGSAADPRIATVTVNGAAATLDAATGNWSASIPVAAEGPLLITVIATDAVGHSSTVTRNVTIDRTAPAVDVRESGASFTATLLNRTISLLVRANDADPNVAVSAKLDNVAQTLLSVLSVGEGAHSLAVSATDCAGHKTDKTLAFTIDLTPPTIRNLNPAGGTTVGQTPNAISGVTDTDAARVEIIGSALAATPNADGTFTIAAVPFAEGTNRFTLKATDRAGNSSQSDYAVTVQTTAPIVSILEGGSPLLAATLFNRAVTPELKVNDPAATISATLNGAPFTSGTTVTADGNYSLIVAATDALHHTGHADTTFVIDRTPPVVKITSPAAGVITTDHPEVRGTAGDAIAATVNGIPVTLNADGTFVLPSLPIDFGTIAIVATGRDRAGNTGRDEVDVTLADSRPGILLTYPPDHSLTNRPTTEVLGRVLSAPPDGVVTIGTASVPVDPSGAFRFSGYALVEGSNTITASVKNQNGTTNSATVNVTADFTPPSLAILESGQPLGDDARFATQAVLSLSASDSGGGSVTSELTVDGAKVVTLPLTVTTTGGHSASATARDAAGNESRVDRTFFIGTTTGGTGSSCALSDFDPKDGSVVLSTTATLVGRSGGALGVKVNGVAATVADASFRATIELPNEGANLVTIVCTDGNGNPTGTPVTMTLNRITGDPSISIATPAEGFATATDTITVTGTAGPGVVTADVNGAAATITGSDISVARPFVAANVRLADGLNVVVAHGKNGAGRVATASRRVYLLKDAPVISASAPISGSSTGVASTVVSGSWTHLDPATIVITNLATGVVTQGGGVATSDTTGTFNAPNVALVPGEQTLKITGRDRLNREATDSVTIKLVAGAPSVVIAQPLDHAYFGPAAGNTFGVSGTFNAAAGSTVDVNGAAATLSGSSYNATVPFATGAGGLTPVVARVTEPGGTSAAAAIVITKLTAAPKVLESFPAPNAVEVDPGALLLVLFSAPMDRASLAGGGFRLEDASGATVSGTLYLDKDVVTFAPAALLTRGGSYTIRVTTAAKDVAGTALAAEYVAAFTVGASAPSTPPTLTPVSSAFCGQTVTIKGTAPAGARLQLESGSITLPATADAQGNFSVDYPLSGQSGYATVRVRIVGSDGSLSPAAELTFRVDCVGPQVLNATYARNGTNTITIVFSEPIDPSTVTGAISLTLTDGNLVTGTPATTGSTVTIVPAQDLTQKSFSLNITTAIKDVIGNKLTAPYTQTFSLATEQPPAGDGTGFISGEVYDATTGRPLAGASVSIEVPATAFSRKAATQQLNNPTTQQLNVTTTTDARGRYLVRLPEGAHTIRATMAGYTTVWRQIIVAAGAGVIPIDVRLTKVGDLETSTGAALTLTHGGETTITRKVTLSVPGGVVASGKSVSLTAVGGQALTGLLPLGWSPISAAEIVSADPLTNAQLTFTVPASDVAAAAQNLTAVRYDELRDSWQVLVPVVNVASNGTASITINSGGAYALVYPDKAAGLTQPALPAAGAVLQGVALPATPAPLTARTFHLDPQIVLPNGRTVATLTIEGLGGANFPSGTAVQAYIDEELKLTDGSTLLDPPFATDLLIYRALNGETGTTDFHLAPSPRAAQVILEVGFDHIRVVPYPGRLDRGTLIGSEGGRVPADDKIAIELPTGATPEPLRATAASLTQSDLDAAGSIAGFRVVGGFNITLQRATEPAPQDLDGDGKPDAVPPVELFKPARATFTVDTTKLPSLTSSLILVELLDQTPYGKMVRLAAQLLPIDPVVAGASARFTTKTIDRSLLPVDGVIREGRYLLLAAEAPIAYATGSVHLGAGGSLLPNARVSANALGVTDLTRGAGIYNIPVVATPAGPFTLTPRHINTGDGAPYTHGAAVAAESINKIDLNLVLQPPALTSVTVIGANQSQLVLSEATVTPNVGLSTIVRASFTPALDPASIDASSIVVVDSENGQVVGGKATGDSTGVTWTLTPGQTLKNNHRYSVTVAAQLRGTNGASFGRSPVFSFTTVAQVTSSEINPDRIGITLPDANGVSRVYGTAGALPSGWQAVPVRRNVDFITRYQATAAADGSFSFNIGDGPDAIDRIKISDLIDLRVVNTAGNVAAIIPLTPFVTEDHRGFVAPATSDVSFTSADGITVKVAAGTFNTATLVNIVPTTPAAVADVPHINDDVEYAASVRLDFDGTANKPLEVELPVPANFDTTGKSFILGYRGDSIRGPRIMAVDTLRIVGGKFTTTLDPNASSLRVSVMSRNGARAGSQQTLTGKDLKNYLMRVQRSGVYMALDIRVPVGGGVGWAVMDGFQQAYDMFWDTLASFYAAHFYIFERARVVIPVITNKPFTVVGIDSMTGQQAFSKVYDPIPNGDPGVAVSIPSPQQNTGGPYPVFSIPFRTELLDLNAEGVDIDAIRNFTVKLQNDQVTVSPSSDPLDSDTKIDLLNTANGAYVSGTAGSSLSVAAKLNDRIVLVIEQQEVDPNSTITVTFNEPIYVDGTTDDAINTFLQSQVKLEKADEPPSGANPTWSDITTQGRYSLDSGGRRLKVELSSSLQREAVYRLTLKKEIADRSGSGGTAGLKLGVGTKKDSSGNLQPVGGGNDLQLLFHVRKPGGKLASFNIASGFVRDIALNGNILLVAAACGADGTGGGLMAYDVADPASLNGTATPLAKVLTGNYTSFWAVASDPHGRVYVTWQGSVLGSLHSYRLEDLVGANGGTVSQKGATITNWTLGYSSSLGLYSNTILSDRPESIPRKLQLLLKDDDQTYNGRDAFKNATGAAEGGNYANGVKKYSVTIPITPDTTTYPYLTQRITVENLSLDMRWSADATVNSPAVIQNIIATPNDQIKVSRNLRTYGVISHLGYGIGVYDLNAMDSNDVPNRPSGYKEISEQVVLSPGKNDPECFQPNTSDAKPPDYAIQEIYLSAEAAIRGDSADPSRIMIYAPDPYRGLLDMRFSPEKYQNNPDPSVQPSACDTRAPVGLIFRATDPSANHPRVQALMSAFQGAAGRQPFIHFISVANYTWHRSGKDNPKGLRGSNPNGDVRRDYVLVAGGDLGVLVVEVGGNPAPNLPGYRPYWPLQNEHLADVIWVPGGAIAVRAIPNSNYAMIVDRAGRVLLADLSRLDERFQDDGTPVGANDLFATVKKCLTTPGASADEVGAYDPRIIWKSEKGIVTGSLAPVIDADTGIVYAGELLNKAVKVVAALDPHITMKVDLGDESGLSEVGGVVPLGIAPPSYIASKISGLPACGGTTTRCRDNASLGVFRLELTLPGAVVDSLSATGNQLQLAVESERVFNAVSEQTPQGFPRSQLRRTKRDGTPEDRPATNFRMQRVVPSDPALEQALRRQKGFNKFISPWIVALADPRAGIDYPAWGGGGTPDQIQAKKDEAGCRSCARPAYLVGKKEVDGVYELWSNGRQIAVRPELSQNGQSIFAGTPYEYLGKEHRLDARFATIMADMLRPADVVLATKNPTAPASLGLVYQSTGEVGDSQKDLELRSRGMAIFATRNYSSGAMSFGPFGRNMDSMLFAHVRPLPDGTVDFYDGRGHKTNFTPNYTASSAPTTTVPTPSQSSLFRPPQGEFLDFYAGPDGTYVLKCVDGTTLRFDPYGRLTSVADRNETMADHSDGNRMLFLYNADGLLDTIIDPVGRTLKFDYHSDRSWLIHHMKDFSGRTVTYDYDTAGRLTTIKGPDPNSARSAQQTTTLEWTQAPTGGDLKQWIYQGAQLTSRSDGRNRKIFRIGYQTGANPWAAANVTQGGGTWQINPGEPSLTIIDPHGSSNTFEHNEYGQIVKRTIPATNGHPELTITYGYDGQGRLKTILASSGGSQTFEYGATGTGVFTKLGNVTKMITQTAEGLIRSRSVDYGAQNLPIVVHEPDGWTLTIDRDERGNAKSISETTGTSTYDYDEHGLLRSSTTPYEGNTVYVYEEDDPKKKGYVKSVTTPAGTTQIDTDVHGNIRSITPPGGTPETFDVNDLDQIETQMAGDSVTTSTYDAAGNVNAKNALAGTAPDGTPVYATVNYETDELGRLTSVTDSGHVTSFGYDDVGDLTQITTPTGAPATLAYDARGLLLSITKAGRTSSYGYNDAGSLTSVTSPSGKVTNINVNGFGEAVGTTDPKGIQTFTRLDTGGHPVDTRQIKTTSTGDKLLLHWTQREYDESGRVTKETRKLFNGTLTLPANGDDPAGATDLVTTVTYDDAAHKETLTDPRGMQTITEYDSMGRRARVTDPAGNKLEMIYDGKSNVSEVRLIAVRQDGTTETFSTKYQYDAKNRITAIIDNSDPSKPLIASYRYDVRGNRTEETDYEGHTRRFEYDLRGNKTKQTDPEGGVTLYKYDDANRLVSVTDANHNETIYTYDADGRLSTEKRADGATWTYTYDDDGNRATVTDPNGTVITDAYDDASRLVSQSIAKGPGVLGPGHITYTRDDLGRVVATETDEGVKTFTTYDSLDRAINEEIQTGSGPRRKVARQFDPAGNLTGITYPSGLALTQTIDPLGRITAVKEAGAASPIVSYGDSGNRQVSKSLANGISETWSYDPNRRLSAIQDRLGDSVVRDLTYARTPLGNKSAAVRNDLAKQWTYQYNRNSWMTNESVLKTGTETNPLLESRDYDVDPVLNYRSIKQLSQSDAASTTTTTTFSVNSRNQYTSAGGESPVYDRNGNVVQLHGAVMQYDYENRLRKATLPYGAVVEYVYDASGRKTEAKLTSGPDTRVTDYVTNDQQVLEEYVGGALSARYTRGRGTDEIVRAEGSTRLDGTVDRTLFPLQDENGNVDRITDASGSTLERYEYSGYGQFHIFAPDSSARWSSAYDWRWLFQGREHDATLGAYDFRARTLWPDLGRFGQEDPARSHKEYSLYEAMSGSPANMTDPSGLYEEDVHHYLSWFLAANGGFFNTTASQIGYEAGKLDINDSRDAMYGPAWLPANDANMRDYHFVSEERLDELKQIANSSNRLDQPALTRIGEFIHALEDSYAHQADEHKRDFSKRYNGLPNKWITDKLWGGLGHGIGHGLHGHRPDQTWRRVGLAMTMAEEVYKEMVNMCVRYTGAACSPNSFEGLRTKINNFVRFQPDMYVQYNIGGLVPVEDVIDYTDKIKKLDSTYTIDHDEWEIRHKNYVTALSQDVRKWIGHKIYNDPKIINGVVTNPDPDSVSGCKCWIGLGE